MDHILEWLHQPYPFGSNMESPIPKYSLSWLLCVTRKGHVTQRKVCFTDNRGKCWRCDPSSSLPKAGVIPGTVAACLPQLSHYPESTGKSPGDCGDKETHHQLLPSSLQVRSLLVRFCILQTGQYKQYKAFKEGFHGLCPGLLHLIRANRATKLPGTLSSPRHSTAA